MSNRSSSPGRLRWQVTAILTLFFFAVAGAAAIGWWYARDSAPHQGPIILIAADGLPAALPIAEPQTSAPPDGIAALVADSVVFERAYTHSPLLLPAYASLIAGQLPFEHGVRDEGGFVLGPDVRTLAELLRSRGFSTGAAVSSTLLVRRSGVAQGFAFYDAAAPAEPPSALPQVAEAVVGASRSGADTIEAAAAWARAQEDQRYFLMVEVDGADAEMAVTRLSALLRDGGSYDRATILLIGTRGSGARGATLDEEGLRVPFAVKQPDQLGAGWRIPDPVQHIDILPTLLDLVRAPAPGGLRGRSFKALLTDEDGRIDPQPIYAESLAAYFRLGGAPVFGLTVRDLRYVRGVDEALERLDHARQTEAVPVDTDPFAEDAPPGDMAPLRATLNRLLGGTRIYAPSPPRAADRERLARAGYLPGLPRVETLAFDAATFGSLEQQSALAAHQSAARLLGDRNYAGALRALLALARMHPDLADLHYQIGGIAAGMGNPQDAVTAFRAALAIRPDSAEIVMRLAAALAQAGQLDDAALEAARAVALASDREPEVRVAAHAQAARVALARLDSESALAHAAAVQTMDSSLPMHLLVEAAIAAKSGDDETALQYLQDAAAVLRQHESALEGVYLRLAEQLSQAARTSDAIAAYEAELREHPQSVEAYSGLARAYQSTGQSGAAEAVLEALVRRVPTRDGYAGAVRAWTAFGRRARAEALRSEARARLRPLPLPLPASLARGTAR